MGLLDRLRAVLGLTSDDARDDRGTTVSVEHEPSTETEAAVKGVEPAGSSPGSTATENGTATDEEVRDAGGAGTGEATHDAGGTGTGIDEETCDTGREDEDERADAGAAEPVTAITGIGSSYGETLTGAGVETVGDLVAADPEALAEETGLGAGRVAGWVEAARERVE